MEMETMKHALRAAMALFFAAAVYFAFVGMANAQQACAARGDMVTRLQVKYKEVQRALMVLADNAIIEIFASEQTGTWTILRTLPGGLSCVLATGVDFSFIEDSDILSPAMEL